MGIFAFGYFWRFSPFSQITGSLFYAAGMLVFNLPDYVGLLDFGSLERCGSGFCKAVAASMKSAFGSGLLAKAGIEFLPLLASWRPLCCVSCFSWKGFQPFRVAKRFVWKLCSTDGVLGGLLGFKMPPRYVWLGPSFALASS